MVIILPQPSCADSRVICNSNQSFPITWMSLNLRYQDHCLEITAHRCNSWGIIRSKPPSDPFSVHIIISYPTLAHSRGILRFHSNLSHSICASDLCIILALPQSSLVQPTLAHSNNIIQTQSIVANSKDVECGGYHSSYTMKLTISLCSHTISMPPVKLYLALSCYSRGIVY